MALSFAQEKSNRGSEKRWSKVAVPVCIFLVHDVEIVVFIQFVRRGSPVKHERIQHVILDELKKPRTATNGYHIFILARLSRVRISVPKVWIHMVLRYSYDSNKMNQDVVDAIR